MTLTSMTNRIAELEVQKDLKTNELDKLNAEYDGIKYFRSEEHVAKKKENRAASSLGLTLHWRRLRPPVLEFYRPW